MTDVRQAMFEAIVRSLILTLVQRSDRRADTLEMLRGQALADVDESTEHDEGARAVLSTSIERFYLDLAAKAGVSLK